MTNPLRLLYVLVALPGRLLIRWLDRQRLENGLLPMGRFLRSSVHGFVWVIALMIFSMATVTPAPVATPAARTAPRYTPPPIPTSILAPMPTPSTSPPTEDADVPYVPLPDDDDDHDWDKPQVCHRKWWC